MGHGGISDCDNGRTFSVSSVLLLVSRPRVGKILKSSLRIRRLALRYPWTDWSERTNIVWFVGSRSELYKRADLPGALLRILQETIYKTKLHIITWYGKWIILFVTTMIICHWFSICKNISPKIIRRRIFWLTMLRWVLIDQPMGRWGWLNNWPMRELENPPY